MAHINSEERLEKKIKERTVEGFSLSEIQIFFIKFFRMNSDIVEGVWEYTPRIFWLF